ncbi:MAG: DNA polymerase III subunit delta [Salibacteraceae bacterium]
MANVKQYEDIMSNLKQGRYAPIYLLYGDEAFYIDKISKYIEQHAIEEHERDFNLSIFYGRDLDYDLLVDSLKRYPMMAPRQVVIIREAQDYKGDWNSLKAYFENPLDTTVLVIDYKYGKPDARKAWVKVIQKNAVAFESKSHYDNELPSVIERFAKSAKYRINPAAAHLMADYLGNDLEKIEGELKKLMINVPLSQEIGQDDVRTHIGISKEFNSFEYSDALARRDHERSYYIAHFLGKNPKNNPMVLITGSLFKHFSQLFLYHTLPSKSDIGKIPGLERPWFQKKIKDSAAFYNARQCALIISELRRLDARYKGVNSSTIKEPELLKELTYFVLNV